MSAAGHHPTDREDWYAIRLRGHLDQRWSEWLDGLQISHAADGTTLLADAGVGVPVDQPGAGEVEDVLLERAYPDQLGVERAQQLRVGGVPVLVGGDDLDPRGRGRERAVLGHGSPPR